MVLINPADKLIKKAVHRLNKITFNTLSYNKKYVK